VDVRIEGPGAPAGGLDELAALWGELQQVHLATAVHRPLVTDRDVSWARRRRWYERVLADGGACFTARPAAGGPPVGYAVVAIDRTLDDTFETAGGMAELLTLVVADGRRGQGLGRRLLAAAQDHVRAQGIDLLRVLVMTGNEAALGFYGAAGYDRGEDVLYRRLT
jgi:ribosomal protein S18 acetylase RimI-like enzyme